MAIKGDTKLKKFFPDYFNRFEMPAGAHEESINVYRACKTGQCDKGSFLPSFEENNFAYLSGDDPDDPSVYSLSTYEKPKDIKRFVNFTSEYKKPYKIAFGNTSPECGLVQRTSERTGKKGSHVDWWLYETSTPYMNFSIITDFNGYYEKYKIERM